MINPFYFNFKKNELNELKKNLSKIFKTNNFVLGHFSNKFEKDFKKFNKSKFSISTNTCTSALEIIFRSLNLKGKKIAIPTNSNFGSVVPAINAGAEVHLINCDQFTLSPDIEIIKSAFKIIKFDALLIVHIGGYITQDIFKIKKFCDKNKIYLIEDCAHAHGSSVNGINAGNFGVAGAFSFFPTKPINTMEGGMIVTKNKKIYEDAQSMRNQGKRKSKFGGLHFDYGNSWRINELGAAMGIIQLKNYRSVIKQKLKLFNFIFKKIDNKKIKLCKLSHMDSHSFYKLIILTERKKEFIDHLNDKEIIQGGGVYDTPIHKHPIFKNLKKIGNLKISEKILNQHICIPFHLGLNKKEIDLITKSINNFI
tara:strand:+ start:578 stop:1678 length:1101 start_codon:yes stop_codon:yes gene_type:complete